MATDGNTSTWGGPKDWETRPLCVLGGGVLGRRIAACFLAAGNSVIIRDPSANARQQAVDYVRENITVYTSLTQHEVGKLEAVQDLAAAVKDCWLVIEAVPEVLEIKQDTFADLEKYAPDDCILVTNSSSYKSGELLGKLQHEATKKRIANMHFMMPPEALIVELMTSGSTEDQIFPFLSARLRAAGLHPYTALKESTGFIFNRIWASVKREVLAILAEGVSTPDVIDSIWIEQYASRKVGPCSMMDSVGLDTVEHIEQHYINDRHLTTYPLEYLQKNFIEKGKLGNKTPGAGGLYAPPAAGSRTKILLLNLGLGEPLKGKTLGEVMNSGQVLRLAADDKNARPVCLVDKLPCPDGIDIAQVDKRMYWTNMGNPKNNDGSIQSAKLDGSDVRYVVKPGTGVHTPKQMIIDQQNNKIYCCDREGLQVVRVNLDGSDLETIYRSGDWRTEPEKVQDQTCWPVGISVSVKHNRFFWTQKGASKASQGRIFSASLDSPSDPSRRTDIEVVIDKLPECIDLEFDEETGFLYWTDRGELPLGNTLNKKQVIHDVDPSTYSFGLGREILTQGLGEGIGLRLDRDSDCLYVADLGGHLWKCSTRGGLKEKLYEGATHAYSGLTFYKD